MLHLMIKLQHYLNASSKLSDSHLRPIVRIQKDILKFQIAVNDLFAVDVVHLKRPPKKYWCEAPNISWGREKWINSSNYKVPPQGVYPLPIISDNRFEQPEPSDVEWVYW